MLAPQPKARAKPPSFVLVILGFAALILVGTGLLMLPASSQSGQVTSAGDALFTATSAVCVTGLVVVDTGSYWSGFGQAVILFLIQFGGFGFMTSATLFLFVLRQRVGLREKILTSQSLGLERYGGFRGLVRRVAIFSVGLEIVGALVLFFRFLPDNSPGGAIWKAFFHSVSAFNNAGFDIMGNFQSLAAYQLDAWVLLTIAFLVIAGGLSYIVIEDLFRSRRFIRLAMDSKIVLTVTALLLLGGMLFILAAEYSNPATLGDLSWPQKVLSALFHSAAARTAGFSDLSMGDLSLGALFFTMLLMFIGGASGSTAGGIKVNNFGLLALTSFSSLRGREHPGAFGRNFLVEQIHRALAVVMVFIGVVSVVTVLLSLTESHSLTDLMFESFSAVGTVGLSTGITPELSAQGRIIITLSMFIGRLGPLSLFSVMVARHYQSSYRYPTSLVRLG
jgi:trk system potassium uptake protein TrkH